MHFETSLVLGQMSFAGWILSTLSTMTNVLVLTSAGLIFFGAFSLVSRKRPASSLAAYLILLPLPLLITVCGWLYGSITSLSALAAVPDLAISNQGIAGGIATALLSVLFAIVVSLPTYAVLAFGLISRDFRTPSKGVEAVNPAPKTPTLNSMAVH